MAEANYSIKATIEANAKKFKSAIQVAKNSAERFKGTMEKIKDNKIDVDSTSCCSFCIFSERGFGLKHAFPVPR